MSTMNEYELWIWVLQIWTWKLVQVLVWWWTVVMDNLWPFAPPAGSFQAPQLSGDLSSRWSTWGAERGLALKTSSCRTRWTPQTSAFPADHLYLLPATSGTTQEVKQIFTMMFNYSTVLLTIFANIFLLDIFMTFNAFYHLLWSFFLSQCQSLRMCV